MHRLSIYIYLDLKTKQQFQRPLVVVAQKKSKHFTSSSWGSRWPLKSFGSLKSLSRRPRRTSVARRTRDARETSFSFSTRESRDARGSGKSRVSLCAFNGELDKAELGKCGTNMIGKSC